MSDPEVDVEAIRAALALPEQERRWSWYLAVTTLLKEHDRWKARAMQAESNIGDLHEFLMEHGL